VVACRKPMHSLAQPKKRRSPPLAKRVSHTVQFQNWYVKPYEPIRFRIRLRFSVSLLHPHHIRINILSGSAYCGRGWRRASI
jgi:hypothetical protein